MGQFFLDYVKSDMGGKAKIGVVGALNSFIQNIRQKGFEDTIKDKAGVTVAGVVDGQNVQDTALSAAENLITGNPDMTAIYATGEPALLGAVAAVESQSKQKDIKVFGWDLTKQAIAGIDAGYVAGSSSRIGLLQWGPLRSRRSRRLPTAAPSKDHCRASNDRDQGQCRTLPRGFQMMMAGQHTGAVDGAGETFSPGNPIVKRVSHCAISARHSARIRRFAASISISSPANAWVSSEIMRRVNRPLPR